MWIVAIILLFPATALGAGQPLIEGNEESPDTADFLSPPKSLYTGAAVTEGAMSELIAHEASSHYELAREKTLVTELSNKAKQLGERIVGLQKSEQLSRKMADLSKAEEEVIRSSCNQKMEEMHFHFRNRTRILKQRLHNCTSKAAFLLNRSLESLRHELQMERDRTFKAEGRVLVLEEELRRTAAALEYNKKKQKGESLMPEQFEGRRKADAGLKAVLAGLRMQLGNKSVELLREEPAWSTLVNQLSAVFAAEQKKQAPKERGMSEVMSEGGSTKSTTENNDERDQLKEEVENLRAQLRKSQQNTLAARTELQGTKDQLVSVQLDLQSARGQIESMSNHTERASDIMVLENVSGKALAAERAELSIAEAELARERRNFRSAQQDLNNARNELAAMTLTRSQLQQKLAAVSSERFAHREDKLRKHKAALHMAIADLNRTRSELEAVRANLAARDAQTGLMHTELQRLRGKMAAKEKMLVADSRQVQRLRRQVLDEGHELNSTETVLSQKLQDLEGVNKSLAAERREVSVLKASLANTTRGLQMEVEVSKDQLNKTRTDLQGLRVKMSAQDHQLKAKDIQLQILNTKERQEEQVLNGTRVKLNATEALLRAKLQNLQAYSNSFVVRMQELESLHNRLKTLAEELNAARADVVAKDLTLNMTSEMLHGLRSRLANKTKLQAALDVQLANLRATVQQDAGTLHSMQEELLGSRSKLNASQHSVREKAEALEVANQLLIAKSRQLEQEHASFANVTVALQQLHQNLDFVNKTLSARQQDLNLVSDKLRVTQAQKTQLEEDWKAAEAQNVNISLALQTKVGDLRAAQAEIETVKSKLLSLRNASTRQESVLRERLSVAAADVQSLTKQHQMQEAVRRDLLEGLSSKGKELNSTRATLTKVESRLAALVTQLGVLQQVHLESEARERSFREVMQQNLTTALGNKDYELSKIHSDMGTIKAKLQGVEIALKQSERARQFLLAEQRNSNVTLDTRNLELENLRAELVKARHRMNEVDAKGRKRDEIFDAKVLEVEKLRKALAVADNNASKIAEEEYRTNATFEATFSEVDRLRKALAVANDKALEAAEKITALKREDSELKVHEATLEATASEVDRLHKALEVANDKAAGEERWTNATLEAKASEVDRLRAALAVANGKALEAAEEVTALKREGSELKVHDATLETTASEVDRLRAALTVANGKALEAAEEVTALKRESSELKVHDATLETTASEVDRLHAALVVANDRALKAAEEVMALKREGSEFKAHDATLETMASEVERLRKALAVANDKAAGEARWSNATLEATASEVDRLHAALAVANDKALEAAEEVTALKRIGSELKVHDANLQREFNFAMAKDAKLNKKLTFEKSDRATLARDLMQVIDRLRVEVRRTREGGMEADAQQVEHELNVAQAAVKGSMEQHAHLASAVESTLAAMTSSLGVRDVQLRTDRSLLEDALANASALQAEVHGLTKALKVEDHALKAAHMLLNTARADVKDLVAAHHAWQPEPVKKLRTEVKKMHNVIEHDEKLIHQYQRRERRLRAQLRFAE